MNSTLILCLIAVAVLIYAAQSGLLNMHIFAYTGTVGNGTDTQLNALTDGITPITNNNFQLQRNSKLLFAWAGGATLTDARFRASSLINYGDVYIHPVQQAAKPGSNPPVYFLDRQTVLPRALEELKVLVNDGVSGTNTERCTVLAVLCGDMDAEDPIPDGPVYTLRFTSTTTVTANAWSQLAITWTTTPPPGVYAILDIHCASANGQAIRMINPPRVWRPGQLMNTNQYDNRWNPEKPWWHGVMGYFQAPLYPLFEVLCNGADSSFTGFVTVKKMTNMQNLPPGYLNAG